MNARSLVLLSAMIWTAATGAASADALPGPPSDPVAGTSQDAAKPQKAGIDCTRGLACPIIWSPPAR